MRPPKYRWLVWWILFWWTFCPWRRGSSLSRRWIIAMLALCKTPKKNKQNKQQNSQLYKGGNIFRYTKLNTFAIRGKGAGVSPAFKLFRILVCKNIGARMMMGHRCWRPQEPASVLRICPSREHQRVFNKYKYKYSI